MRSLQAKAVFVTWRVEITSFPNTDFDVLFFFFFFILLSNKIILVPDFLPQEEIY